MQGRFKNNSSSQLEFVQFLTKANTLGTNPHKIQPITKPNSFNCPLRMVTRIFKDGYKDNWAFGFYFEGASKSTDEKGREILLSITRAKASYCQLLCHSHQSLVSLLQRTGGRQHYHTPKMLHFFVLCRRGK